MRKICVACAGGVVLCFGVVMLPLPGPGLPFIVGGLALLAAEFPWAKRAFGRVRRVLAAARGRIIRTGWWRRMRAAAWCKRRGSVKPV